MTARRIHDLHRCLNVAVKLRTSKICRPAQRQRVDTVHSISSDLCRLHAGRLTRFTQGEKALRRAKQKPI